MQSGVLSTTYPGMMYPVADRTLKTLAACVAVGTLVACSDAASPTANSPLAPLGTHPMTPVAHLRGTLDVAAGTLTFDPVSTSGVPVTGGPSAASYGDQGVNVQIYNSAVVTSAPAGGKKTYTATVGVKNLLAYRIGDEQNAAAPADTMGIYVFLNTAPIVSGTSSPCSCTVTAKNADGVRNFNATNQSYWYWPDILGARGSARDTTLARKPWVFEADTQVTRFNFDVLVSAAWASPNETVWTVDYPADSLPDTQAEPRWRRIATSKVTAVAANGLLDLEVQRSKDSILFVRRDSVSSTSSAYVEARFRLNNGGNDPSPQAGIALDDNARHIALLVSDSAFSGPAQVGFANASGGLLAGAVAIARVDTMHTYTLRKFGADSAVAYVDGVRRVKAVYSALPTSQYPAGQPSLFEFGIVSTSAKSTVTTWDYVSYQIGAATP